MYSVYLFPILKVNLFSLNGLLFCTTMVFYELLRVLPVFYQGQVSILNPDGNIPKHHCRVVPKGHEAHFPFLSVTEMFCCQILSSFSLDLFCLCYGKVFVVYIQSKLQIKSEQSKYQSKSFNNSPTFQDQCLKLAVQTCLLKPSYANCGCIISKIFRLFYVHGILSKIDLAFKYFFV